MDKAKNWVKTSARGSERYGLFASSNAARLRPRGIYYAKDRSSLSPENWFLNGKDDIRSSYFLEAVASEFETQGLELDYAIVAWDADLRIENGRWTHNQMSNRLSPPNWSRIRSENNVKYLTNAYERCMMCINQNGAIILPIPAMVNSAFSVELFLKAVIKERTGECRSHKLSDLFNRLPIEIQQEIMNDTNHSDFETQIERFSDAFVDFRYIYEDIFKTKDLNLKFWEDFSSAIYKIVPTHIAQKGAPLYIDPSIK